MSGSRSGNSAPTFGVPSRSLRAKRAPATWFYRVALQTAMNWHRNDRPRRLHQQPLLEVHALAVESTNTSRNRAAGNGRTPLPGNSPIAQGDVALVLLYLDEMSYREMASVLGISESNVGVKLNRAKKALAALLDAAPAKGEFDESR